MIKKTLVQFGDVHHLVVVNDGHLIYPPDDAQTEDMMLTTVLHACEILTTRVSQTGSVLFILNSRIREDEHTLSNFASALDEKLRIYAKQLAKQRAPLRVNIITTNLAAHAVFCKMPVAQRKRALHSISERLPLRRRFSPKYLADAVVFLLGNEFITNADIPVDGGESL